MSSKQLKKTKGNSCYYESSVNINNVNKINLQSNLKFISFKNNTNKFYNFLTPSDESSLNNIQNDSPSFNYISKIIENRCKSVSSKSESPKNDDFSNKDDKSDSIISGYDIRINKDTIKECNSIQNNSTRNRNIEYQLYQKCDPVKISKELSLLIKKLSRKSSSINKNRKNNDENNLNYKNGDPNPKKISPMLNNKRFNEEKLDNRIMNITCNHIYQTRSKSNNNNGNFKDQTIKFIDVNNESRKNITKDELSLNINENDIINDINICYSNETNHKSKDVLAKKRKKLRYESMKNSNISFIIGLNNITGSFPLKTFKKSFYYKCLKERISIANVLLKDSIKMMLTQKLSRFDTLKNLKKSLKGNNLVFFKFKFYLHCESIADGKYAIDINNEIIETENDFKYFDVYSLEKERI